MAGRGRWGMQLAMAALLGTGLPAHGQGAIAPAYKCGSRDGVVYTDKTCPGGQEVGPAGARKTDKHKPPPQDRAKATRRAQLAPEVRQECEKLEVTLKEQEAEFQAKGTAATLQDETPLVKSKLRFRELKC
jgi:hypothetical protein